VTRGVIGEKLLVEDLRGRKKNAKTVLDMFLKIVIIATKSN